MQNVFGSGFLYGIPTTDATGAAIANPSPIQFGVVQDVSVDMSFDNKALHGQLQFPVAVGRGKGKIQCKAKMGQINGATFNSLFFGVSSSTGLIAAYNDVTGAAIPTTPFTITPVVPNSGTFKRDLGVKSAVGVPLTRVTGTPAAGQYAVNVATGVYTFATADTGLRVFINFEYTASVAGANKSTGSNLAMGYAPTFAAVLSAPYQGKTFHLTLYSCIASKLSFALKNDDFSIPEIDFDCFADASSYVYDLSLSE